MAVGVDAWVGVAVAVEVAVAVVVAVGVAKEFATLMVIEADATTPLEFFPSARNV